MPINGRELVQALQILSNERNVRVTVKSSAQGACVCAASTFAGGILLGPVGMAIGGTAGGLLAYKMSRGKFRPLGEVLMNDLTDAQRELLAEHIGAAVADFRISDVAMLLTLMASNTSLQAAVWSTVSSFVTNELRMQIVD